MSHSKKNHPKIDTIPYEMTSISKDLTFDIGVQL